MVPFIPGWKTIGGKVKFVARQKRFAAIMVAMVVAVADRRDSGHWMGSIRLYSRDPAHQACWCHVLSSLTASTAFDNAVSSARRRTHSDSSPFVEAKTIASLSALEGMVEASPRVCISRNRGIAKMEKLGAP